MIGYGKDNVNNISILCRQRQNKNSDAESKEQSHPGCVKLHKLF